MSSNNKRVYINPGQWKKTKGGVSYDETFKHPFNDLLRSCGNAVSKGTFNGTVDECDGVCDKEGKTTDHLHISPTVQDVKISFDVYRAERPAPVHVAERKLDGVAGYVARLAEANPGVDIAPAKLLYDGAVCELVALKASGATDFKSVVKMGEEVAAKVHELILESLVLKAVHSTSGLSEEARKECEVKIGAALKAGGREGISQLSDLVKGWDGMAERLARWGKPSGWAEKPKDAAETRPNRSSRRQSSGWVPR